MPRADACRTSENGRKATAPEVAAPSRRDMARRRGHSALHGRLQYYYYLSSGCKITTRKFVVILKLPTYEWPSIKS